MEIVLVGIAMLIAAGVISATVKSIGTRSRQRSLRRLVDRMPGFRVSQGYIGEDGLAGVAIDQDAKLLCLVSRHEAPRVLGFRDILACELYEDGETITRTVRTSQVAGALIGGLAFGGLGAVVGGLSGKTRASRRVKHIDLRLLVNDTEQPTHDVRLLDIPAKSGSSRYETAMEIGRHWVSLMDVIIKRADIEDQASRGRDAASANSNADEIRKLADLRREGVLTEAEFETQKKRLLA